MIDKLKPYIDKGDKFFIVEIVNNKQGWLTEKQWGYINNNIFIKVWDTNFIYLYKNISIAILRSSSCYFSFDLSP